VNYTIPKDLTFEDFQKDPYLKFFAGLPPLETPTPARHTGQLPDDVVRQLLSNPDVVNQLLSALAASRGAP
jgi:hypothetical protein